MICGIGRCDEHLAALLEGFAKEGLSDGIEMDP
jgi:hypothetical protein